MHCSAWADHCSMPQQLPGAPAVLSSTTGSLLCLLLIRSQRLHKQHAVVRMRMKCMLCLCMDY